jgi:heptosyltransferase-2
MGPPLQDGARVLVHMPSWLGDFVQAEPALRALAERAERDALALSIAGEARFLELLGGRFPSARRIAHPARGAEDPRAWRGHDVAVLFPGSFRSAWLAWRAGIQRRIGWSRDGRGFLLTDRIAPALERGATPLGLGVRVRGRRYLPRPYGTTCIELIGLAGVAVSDTTPRLLPTEAGEEAARARLSELGFRDGEDFWLASVGGRPESAKAVPVERWAAMLGALAPALGLPVLLVAGPGEDERLREIYGEVAGTRIAAAQGRPVALSELVALARRARLVVVADSGPRHVAKAAGARVVTLLGPTDPRHGAEHLERERLVRVEVPCGPCHRERCPLAGAEHHRCMLDLDPREVVARARELLG